MSKTKVYYIVTSYTISWTKKQPFGNFAVVFAVEQCLSIYFQDILSWNLFFQCLGSKYRDQQMKALIINSMRYVLLWEKLLILPTIEVNNQYYNILWGTLYIYLRNTIDRFCVVYMTYFNVYFHVNNFPADENIINLRVITLNMIKTKF